MLNKSNAVQNFVLLKNFKFLVNNLKRCPHYSFARSKPMILLLIFRRQMKIFVMESERFLSLH